MKPHGMNAYVVRERAPLPPFRKPASQVRLNTGTIASRLDAQLRAAGLRVIHLDERSEGDPIEPHSLVVTDDLVVSDRFLERMLAAIPDRSKNYQCEIESGRFAMLASKTAPRVYKKLPVRYRGTDPSAEFLPLRLDPVPVLEVMEGIPARMQALTDICVCFFDMYAVELDYWFDLKTASSLYCREFVAGLLRPFRARVPEPILSRFTNSSWVMSKCNSIGRNTRIHPTAILEGCVVGDRVEIGPYSYLRASVIGDDAVLREKSSVKTSYIGPSAFVMGSDIVNSYVGAETSIFCPMLYNVVFGERGFLSGGSGFADFIVGAESIPAMIDGKQVQSGLAFLASAVGDDCFIGANLLFAPGRTIPDGTRLLDHGLIKSIPTTGGSFVVSGTDLLQIPDGFLTRKGG